MDETREQFRAALKVLKSRNRVSFESLAQYAGCTGRHVQAAVSDKEDKGVGSAVASRLSSFFGLSYSEMLAFGARILSGEEPDTNGFVDHADYHEDEFVPVGFTLIPLFQSKLSNGHDSFDESGEILSTLAFRSEFVRKLGDPEQMAMFTVLGESMEPFLYHGDVVLVDLQQNEPEMIVDGKAYAYRDGQTVKVRRLSTQGRDIISSSEKTSHYPPHVVDLEVFQLIGKVIWVCHNVT